MRCDNAFVHGADPDDPFAPMTGCGKESGHEGHCDFTVPLCAEYGCMVPMDEEHRHSWDEDK